MMATRQPDQDLETWLDELVSRSDQAQERIDRVEREAPAEEAERIAALRQEHRALRARLDVLRRQRHRGWERIKAEVEDAWLSLEENLNGWVARLDRRSRF
jgi:hypothetical protein